MAEQRHNRSPVAGLNSAPEFVKTVLAYQSPVPPGTIADEIDAMLNFLDSRFGQLQAQVVGQKLNQPFSIVKALLPRKSKQDKIVHVAHVMPDFESTLDIVIQRIEIDQGVQLRQQIADRNAEWSIHDCKQHHAVHETLVFDFLLDQHPQHVAINGIEKFANIQFKEI